MDNQSSSSQVETNAPSATDQATQPVYEKPTTMAETFGGPVSVVMLGFIILIFIVVVIIVRMVSKKNIK